MIIIKWVYIKFTFGICSIIIIIVTLWTCGSQPTQTDPPHFPLVAVTFDDGNLTQYDKGFRIMKEVNSSWSATIFVCGAYPWGGTYLNTKQLHEMYSAGWEIGAHSYTHVHLSELPMDSVVWQVNTVYNYLLVNGFDPKSFAYPYGSCNAQIRSIVETRFKNLRGSADAHYPDGVDPTDLGYFAVYNTNTITDITNRIEQAISNNEPLVIIGFHVIVPDSITLQSGAYCKESTYREFLRYLDINNLNAYSIRNAIDILNSNKLCKSLSRSIQCGH